MAKIFHNICNVFLIQQQRINTSITCFIVYLFVNLLKIYIYDFICEQIIAYQCSEEQIIFVLINGLHW